MQKSRPPYPRGFRHQMVELVRNGQTPEELAWELERTAQAMRNWVARADRAWRGSCIWPASLICPVGECLLTRGRVGR